MNSPRKTPWPQALCVTPLDQWKLRAELDDGRILTLDLKQLIEQRDAYWRLRRERYFCRVGIDPLGAICWPEGEDIAPESLERYTVLSSPPTMN